MAATESNLTNCYTWTTENGRAFLPCWTQTAYSTWSQVDRQRLVAEIAREFGIKADAASIRSNYYDLDAMASEFTVIHDAR